MNSIECSHAKEMFSGYLDGAVSGKEMQAMAAHLEGCASCQSEFDGLRSMQRVLSAVGTKKAPADLGMKLRIAISHESARRQGHWWDGLEQRWANGFKPALVQVSAGVAGAILLLGSLAGLIGIVAVPQAVQANDEPLGALSTPHYLYSAVLPQPVVTGQDTTIVIEAHVNADGRVYDYSVISGPQDAATLAQIRNQLMVQVYEPARVFGEPIRGRVLITFAGVSVKG
jgi:anti-sigma factor RsiW